MHIQVCLVLLYFSLLHFACIVFYKLKTCGSPALSKSVGDFFQQHLLTSCLCHILAAPCISNFFNIIFVMVIGDL